MGGINPPASTFVARQTTQKFTHELCNLNLSFWKGHAAIERAVLSDDGSQTTQSELVVAGKCFEAASVAAIQAATLASSSDAFASDEAVELTDYLAKRLSDLSMVADKLKLLAHLICRACRESMSGSELQQAMLYNGRYCEVRHNSLTIVDTLAEINAAHAELVHRSNLVTSVAA